MCPDCFALWCDYDIVWYIYSLMLVGRVERIFTRVGGTQLQSLAHPPGGGTWSASYDEM